MAAVVDRADECVGSFDSDAVSLRQSTPPPDQNNPLLGLPIVAIETILNFLSYDEISLLRSVRRTKTIRREGAGEWASGSRTHWTCLGGRLVGVSSTSPGAQLWTPGPSLSVCVRFIVLLCKLSRVCMFRSVDCAGL